MGVESRNLRLGTRGSLLAKTQSQLIATELEKRCPGLAVELIVLKTSADQIPDKPLYEFGGKGLFVKELEQALLANEVDVAVHSFKDVPITQPLVDQNELIIASVPQREDPRDVLCSIKAKAIEDIPRGGRVGTSSLRRRAWVLEQRADVNVKVLRGNIDTRLRKLRDDEYDAIFLAAAGLRRCGLYNDAEMTTLSPEEFVPAAGQGALALQCRHNDAKTRDLLCLLDHAETRLCVTAERVLIAALGGDCHSPIGALARLEGDEMVLRAAVGSRGGAPPVIRASAAATLDRSDVAVAAVLKSLLEQNVQAMLGTGGGISSSF
jgi:hydroxymethylbilane synthase